MRLKNYLIILFLFVFVFSGYADTKDVINKDNKETEVKKVAKKVDKEEDALVIAEDFLKENGLAGDYYLFRYLIQLKKDIWQVVFLKKEKTEEFGKVKSIRVEINQKTGQIIEHKEQEGFLIDTQLR